MSDDNNSSTRDLMEDQNGQAQNETNGENGNDDANMEQENRNEPIEQQHGAEEIATLPGLYVRRINDQGEVTFNLRDEDQPPPYVEPPQITNTNAEETNPGLEENDNQNPPGPIEPAPPNPITHATGTPEINVEEAELDESLLQRRLSQLREFQLSGQNGDPATQLNQAPPINTVTEPINNNETTLNIFNSGEIEEMQDTIPPIEQPRSLRSGRRCMSPNIQSTSINMVGTGRNSNGRNNRRSNVHFADINRANSTPCSRANRQNNTFNNMSQVHTHHQGGAGGGGDDHDSSSSSSSSDNDENHNDQNEHDNDSLEENRHNQDNNENNNTMANVLTRLIDFQDRTERRREEQDIAFRTTGDFFRPARPLRPDQKF